MKYATEKSRMATETDPATGDTTEPEAELRRYLYASLVLSGISILFIPPLFGLLAAICGLVVLLRGRPFYGAALIVIAVIAAVIGMILGELAMLGLL